MVRNRIVDYRRVPARELLANPRNWRRHPSAQRNALTGLLESIGFVGALLAYERESGLILLNGHLRAKIDPSAVLPVVVADLTDDEADFILSTFDPVSSMAFGDVSRLNDLLGEVKSSATRFLENVVEGVDMSFLDSMAAAGNAAMAEVQAADGSTVLLSAPPAMTGGPTPPPDLFLRPLVDRDAVKSWAIHIPRDAHAPFIDKARTLAEAMGYADDAAGLVMACIRLVAEEEGVSV